MGGGREKQPLHGKALLDVSANRFTEAPLLGRVLARLPWWLSLALSDLLIGAGFGATGLAHTQWAFAGTIVMWTMGEMLLAPVHPTVVSALAPSGLRATYQGFFQLAWGAATLVGPTVGTQLLSRFGGSVLWGACFCTGCVALLSHLVLGRLRPKLSG